MNKFKGFDFFFIEERKCYSYVPVRIRSHVCTQRRAVDERHISATSPLFNIAVPDSRAVFKPRTKTYNTV
jgi:hypothetical protein